MPNNIPLQNTSFEPGTAPEGFIPLCVPVVRGNEWKYVKDCFDTGWVSSVGDYVNRFENTVAQYAGASHGVAVVNGTSAIQIALLLAGVQPNDEVVVSTLTFIAPVNAIRYVHAWPVLIDAEPIHWQMDVQKLADFLNHECNFKDGHLTNKHTGRRVKALMPVHVLGHTVDMDSILEFGRKFNLAIIEDATECLGAKYKGRMAGSMGDAGVFSFNGNKIITTGGGGMLVTSKPEWATRAKYLTTQAKDDPLEYIHNEIGYNFRLTNVLAAFGCAQMEKLEEFIHAKKEIAARYISKLASCPGLKMPEQASWCQSIWWMFTVLVDPNIFGEDSRQLLRRLQAKNIQSRPLWQPAHKSPAHSGAFAYKCEIADQLNRSALSLPCSAGLTAEEQDRVISAILKR